MKTLKYLLFPFCAFGLSTIPLFGVKYNGLPEYIGAPFIFAQKSMGSSMEYFYSLPGIAMNLIIWSLLLIVLWQLTKKLFHVSPNSYKTLKVTSVVVLLLLSVLGLWMFYVSSGSSFTNHLEFDYWPINEECKTEWMFFPF